MSLSLSQESDTYYESFPANQLGHPELDDAYYGFNTSQASTKASPLVLSGEEEMSQKIGDVSTQAFDDCLGRFRDSAVTLEHTPSAVRIIHDIEDYKGPDHIVSREHLKKLNGKCPYDRLPISCVEDVSKKVAGYLAAWFKVRFPESGDNCLHKALRMEDRTLFDELLKLPNASVKLFEVNKKGEIPFDLLFTNTELKAAVIAKIPLLPLAEADTFSFLQAQKLLLFESCGVITPFSVTEPIEIAGTRYTLNYLDRLSFSVTVYLSDEAGKVFRIENSSINPRFSLNFSVGDKSMNLEKDLPLVIGRRRSSCLQVGSPFVSSRHWIIELNDKGRFVLSMFKTALNASMLVRELEGGELQKTPITATTSLTLEKGDSIYIGTSKILTFQGACMKEMKPPPSRKRGHSEISQK